MGIQVRRTATAAAGCAQAALQNSAALGSPIWLQWLSAISAQIPHYTNLCNESVLEMTIHQLTRLVALMTEAWLKIPDSSRKTPSPAFLLPLLFVPSAQVTPWELVLPLCPHAVRALPLMTFPKWFHHACGFGLFHQRKEWFVLNTIVVFLLQTFKSPPSRN